MWFCIKDCRFCDFYLVSDELLLLGIYRVSIFCFLEKLDEILIYCNMVSVI